MLDPDPYQMNTGTTYPKLRPQHYCRRVDLCVQMVRGTDLKILGLVGSDAGVYQCLYLFTEGRGGGWGVGEPVRRLKGR